MLLHGLNYNNTLKTQTLFLPEFFYNLLLTFLHPENILHLVFLSGTPLETCQEQPVLPTPGTVAGSSWKILMENLAWAKWEEMMCRAGCPSNPGTLLNAVFKLKGGGFR